MPTVGKFVALMRPKRTADCPRDTGTSLPDFTKAAKPSADDKDIGRRHGPEQAQPSSSWDTLHRCVQQLKDDHDAACRDHLTAMAEKDREIEHLKGTVDELLKFAFTQQEYVRAADKERAAKDRQIAQLLQAVARNERASDRVPRKEHLDLGDIGLARHRIAPVALPKAA